MRLNLIDGRPLSDEEIRAFEEIAGVRLPRDYREFVLFQDGAAPGHNRFPVLEGGDPGVAVNRFIPLYQTLKEKTYIDGVPYAFLPVAWAACGNYVCLRLDAGGEVFFWDHEEPVAVATLAGGFGEFLEKLLPFDTPQAVLKPGQVEEAWIDPDFLKSLGR